MNIWHETKIGLPSNSFPLKINYPSFSPLLLCIKYRTCISWYPPFPLLSYFFRGYVPEMFATSYSVTYCIYFPGKPGICFYHYFAVYDDCKYSDTFWLVDRTRLFVQYTISLSSLCKLIWRHWTYKMPVRYISSSVWVRLSIFSLLSIIEYVELYVFSLPISVVMIERIYIYTLSYYHHQIGSMNYYPLFRIRSWNNRVRCMSFYILMMAT